MATASISVDFSKQYDLGSLKGRTALVTGGASGIGAGLVKALAEKHAYVVIADINEEGGRQLSDTLNSNGYRTLHVKTDVTDWNSQVQAFKKALAFSPNNVVDIVVAGAGIAGASMEQIAPFTTPEPSEDPLPPTPFVQMINVNLIGVLYTSTLASYYWHSNGKPELDLDCILIMIASNIAYYPMPGFTGYSSSKMGVRGLWKSLRETPQFKSSCRTNLLAPHVVRSPMTTGLQPLLDGQGIRMVEVSECVDCLLRFCCDRGIRGRAVQVNAGHAFDLHDDLDDLDGAKVFKEHWDSDTRRVFDFFDGSQQMS